MATTGVAVVTGAGSGLGRCIAQALLAAGWQVAVAGRRERTLAETLASAAGQDGAGLAVPTDVTVPESVAALFEAVRERWQRVDLLVNNAGMFGPPGAVDEISWVQWQNAVNTNAPIPTRYASASAIHVAMIAANSTRPMGGAPAE